MLLQEAVPGEEKEIEVRDLRLIFRIGGPELDPLPEGNDLRRLLFPVLHGQADPDRRGVNRFVGGPGPGHGDGNVEQIGKVPLRLRNVDRVVPGLPEKVGLDDQTRHRGPWSIVRGGIGIAEKVRVGGSLRQVGIAGRIGLFRLFGEQAGLAAGAGEEDADILQAGAGIGALTEIGLQRAQADPAQQGGEFHRARFVIAVADAQLSGHDGRLRIFFLQAAAELREVFQRADFVEPVFPLRKIGDGHGDAVAAGGRAGHDVPVAAFPALPGVEDARFSVIDKDVGMPDLRLGMRC